jgi:hypothetical protein
MLKAYETFDVEYLLKNTPTPAGLKY